MQLPLSSPSRRVHAMTLIELLVVIAIIGTLAGLIVPAVVKAQTKAKVAKAKTDMAGIKAAIAAYQSDYSRLPASAGAMAVGGDFTYGTVAATGYAGPAVAATGAYQASNAELMLILTAQTQFPNYTTNACNANHARNPKKRLYLNVTVNNNNGPGLGTDGVYRDPWGNPYIITLDLNYDNFVAPAVYNLQAVSQITAGNPAGHYGLISRTSNGAANDYSLRDTVAIWSMGPDGKKPTGGHYDATVKANIGPNLDNVLNW